MTESMLDISKIFKGSYSGKELVILEITLFKISGKTIGEILHENRQVSIKHFERMFPRYTINKDFGNIMDFDYYYQFTFEGEKEDYIGFDSHGATGLTASEISEVGFADLFKDQDLRPLFKELVEKNYANSYLSKDLYPTSINLIVETEYSGGNDYFHDDDFESHSQIIGYLDGNLDKILVDVVKRNELRKDY